MSFWEKLGPAAIHPDPNRTRGGIPEITSDDVRAALGGLRERPFRFGMAAFLGHRGSMDRLEVLLEHDILEMAEAGRWGEDKDEDGQRTGDLTLDQRMIVFRLTRLVLFEAISARSRHDTYAHEEALPTGSATILCPGCRGRGTVARQVTDEELSDLDLLCEEALQACRAAAGEEGMRRPLHDQLAAERSRRTLARAGAHDEDCQMCQGRGRFVLTHRRRAQAVGLTLRTWERHWAGRYAEAQELPRDWEAIAVGHVRKRLRG